MRKILFAVSLIVGALSARAQSFTGPSQFGNYATNGGLVTFKSWLARTSIGASWGGANTLYGSGYLGFNIAQEGSNMAQPWTYLGDGANNGGNAIVGTVGGELLFVCKPSTGGADGAMSNNDIRSHIRMRITPDGRMMIGRSYVADAPEMKGDYNLYVEKGILTEKVRVAVRNSNDWADYVFAPDYKMMPLKQLEHYVRQNKHLPGVPSAQDVVKNGVDLQQMDATLLQKVEELTLMVIQQQKEIDALKVGKRQHAESD